MHKLNILLIVIIIILVILMIAVIRFNANKLKLMTISNKLWLDHVSFTREFILTTFAGNDNARNAAVAALTVNQKDLGHFIGSYLNKDAIEILTGLLTEHIAIASDIVFILATPGPINDQELKKKQGDWIKNGNEIADNLHSMFGTGDFHTCMMQHLSETTNEVMSIKNGDYTSSIKIYYAIEKTILEMSEKIVNAIIHVKRIPMIFWTSLPCCQ